MSNNLEIKQLRNEIQLLRDDFAIMKRKYEDMFYNLDTDNFSQRVVKQGKDMYSKIEQTAGEISLQAEKITDTEKNIAELSVTATQISSEVKTLTDKDKELSSKITQTANEIRSEVQSAVADVSADTDEKLKNYSTITQTAEKIASTVTKEYVTNLIDGEYVTDATLQNYSTIEQTDERIESIVSKEYVTDLVDGEYVTNTTLTSKLTETADGIHATVSKTYATKGTVDTLSSSIANLWVNADGISTKVENLEDGQYGDYTLFTQTSDTFIFDGKYMRISSAVILTDNDGDAAFSIFHDQSSNSPEGGIVYLWGAADYKYTPVVIGNEDSYGKKQPIYLYSINDDNLIATQGWVLDNAGTGGTATAVFG